MKRLILLAILALLSSATLSAQNANVKYSGNARPGEVVYSCAYDGFVNMRQTPSYKAAKVGKFKNGPTGAVLIQNLGEWMHINYNGTKGYVPSRFVQDEPTVAYVGSATASDISGVWIIQSEYNVYNIYDNGYWMVMSNYFPYAYGYYIMQNNEVKLIAVEQMSDPYGDNGNPAYELVREVYDTIPMRSFNSQTRVRFLTGYETEEELEGIPPFYCTAAKFKADGKSAAARVKRVLSR